MDLRPFSSHVSRRRLMPLRYLAVLSVPLLAAAGFLLQGLWSWALPLCAYLLVPLVELALVPDAGNLDPAEADAARHARIYDWILYAMVPVQWALLGLFVLAIHAGDLAAWEYAGMVFTMGIACGVLGINVAHELGHRTRRAEQWLARVLLLSTQYMHFCIEHNRGHHVRVGTAEDPATARFGESLYAFWVRSIVMGYRSAWRLECQRMERAGRWRWHPANEMIRFATAQLGFLGLVAVFFGPAVTGAVLAAALIGILLLETVNYVEHYGLVRGRTGVRRERVKPMHSWNSNHPLGRLLLFELSRHSDHHYLASRPYQLLRSLDDAPQLPTGYSGMMLLALVPPAWFALMNPRVRALDASVPG
jgi:alkane 1-monooxygenase